VSNAMDDLHDVDDEISNADEDESRLRRQLTDLGQRVNHNVYDSLPLPAFQPRSRRTPIPMTISLTSAPWDRIGSRRPAQGQPDGDTRRTITTRGGPRRHQPTSSRRGRAAQPGAGELRGHPIPPAHCERYLGDDPLGLPGAAPVTMTTNSPGRRCGRSAREPTPHAPRADAGNKDVARAGRRRRTSARARRFHPFRVQLPTGSPNGSGQPARAEPSSGPSTRRRWTCFSTDAY